MNLPGKLRCELETTAPISQGYRLHTQNLENSSDLPGSERSLSSFESQSIQFLRNVSDGLLAGLWWMAVAEQNFHNVPCGLVAAVADRLFILILQSLYQLRLQVFIAQKWNRKCPGTVPKFGAERFDSVSRQ